MYASMCYVNTKVGHPLGKTELCQKNSLDTMQIFNINFWSKFLKNPSFPTLHEVSHLTCNLCLLQAVNSMQHVASLSYLFCWKVPSKCDKFDCGFRSQTNRVTLRKMQTLLLSTCFSANQRRNLIKMEHSSIVFLQCNTLVRHCPMNCVTFLP